MSIELKIKSKSLSEEAKIIRKEEKKQLGWSRYARTTNEHDPAPSLAQYTKLRNHRTNVVREQARYTHLARAYLKGTPYKKVEGDDCKGLFPWQLNNIYKMVSKYGGLETDYKDLKNWIRA